eukprot:605967-Alexandrium_andersonii.AAC.1
MFIGPCAGLAKLPREPVHARWFHCAWAWASCGLAKAAASLATMIPARDGGRASPTARQSVVRSPERFTEPG